MLKRWKRKIHSKVHHCKIYQHCTQRDFFFLINLFFYFWLCWVFISVWGLSLVVASGGHSSSRRSGLSLSWPLSLWSTGSRRTASAVVAHGPSCSTACGIFPDQGSNPCPLHWQADSQPLRHQGSPQRDFLLYLEKFFLKSFMKNFRFRMGSIFSKATTEIRNNGETPSKTWGKILSNLKFPTPLNHHVK